MVSELQEKLTFSISNALIKGKDAFDKMISKMCDKFLFTQVYLYLNIFFF